MKPSVFFPKNPSLFSMQGKDARDLLNRITTANVRAMNAGQASPAFILSAQGKIRCAFRIGCLGDDRFFLEIEGGQENRWKTEALSVLDQFTFAEKYELQEQTEWANAWIFGAESITTEGEETIEEKDPLFLFHGSRAAYGSSWISVWGARSAIDAWISSLNAHTFSEEEFESFRIRALRPAVDRELIFEANPLEIGMRSGIADNKGCYPGQEVIEKIISLGSPAKRLALLSGVKNDSDPAPKPGDRAFSHEGSELGVLTSASSVGNEAVGLILLRKNALEVGKKVRVGPSLDSSIEMEIERISQYE